MGPFLLYDFLYLAHLFTTLRGKSPVSGCILNNCLDTKKGHEGNVLHLEKDALIQYE